MTKLTIPKGTIIHIQGIPCELVEDAEVYTVTGLDLVKDSSSAS